MGGHSYGNLIPDVIDLGRELEKIPGDLNKFITEKGPALEKDAEQIKNDDVKLVSDIKAQFQEIKDDIHIGGIQGFVKAFDDLTAAVTQDIKTGQDVGSQLGDMLKVLEEQG